MRVSWRLVVLDLVVVCAAAAALLAATVAVSGAASAQSSPERVVSYDTTIAIERGGSILVTERIVYDFGSDVRHGIFREIPDRFRYDDRSDRIYPIQVRSVQSPDAPAQYTVDNTGSLLSIRIGDPGQTVTGVHTYTLTYLVRDSLNAFADHDELYWNATGNQWGVPIGEATVRVTAPAAVTRAACFAGPAGSASACQQARIAGGAASFAQAGLGPHQGLTVVVAIPKGVVAPPLPLLRQRWSLAQAFALTPVTVGVSAGLLEVLVIIGAVVTARRRHRSNSRSAARSAGHKPAPGGEPVPLPPRGQPALESGPPEDVRPGQAGTLLDGAANPRDVTGTIVDLAVRGYLRIADAPAAGSMPDWRLARLAKTGGLLDYEQILLDGLFLDPATDDGRPGVLLSELGSTFAVPLKEAQDALYKDVAARGWFTARPDRVRRRWLTIGAALLAAGAVATVITAASSHLGLIPIPVALAGLLLIGCARWMPARTATGTDLARRLLGFRDYLAAGHAFPAGQEKLLEDYLPYAIVFGCTEQWADITASLGDADRAPAWYRSSQPYSPGSMSSFSRSSYYFSPVHHFATAASTWIASTASASGRSGFSGGGYSGGGGGGGGGGSW
jgi:uncharacterized membrane protein YgcG